MTFVSDELFYATPNLDRRAHLRHSDEWWLERIEKYDGRFLLLHENRNLFTLDDSGHSPAFLNKTQVSGFLGATPWAFLGNHNDSDVFALDATALPEKTILSGLGLNYVFEDLRRAGPITERDLASQCAYARGLMFWHQRHLHCGACGSRTIRKDAGHMRKCVNSECGLEHFPRTDPAVIMLVHDGERCLLAHHDKLRDGVYSTLAGFVEPGETLEQAVRREVLEETGVHVSDVRYAGSQPWPFPTSLMVGFYAKATTSHISLDDDELEDAQWFFRHDLINFKDQGKVLPSRDSIARNLIEAWIKEV